MEEIEYHRYKRNTYLIWNSRLNFNSDQLNKIYTNKGHNMHHYITNTQVKKKKLLP